MFSNKGFIIFKRTVVVLNEEIKYLAKKYESMEFVLRGMTALSDHDLPTTTPAHPTPKAEVADMAHKATQDALPDLNQSPTKVAVPDCVSDQSHTPPSVPNWNHPTPRLG